MQDKLKQVVIGQDDAIDCICPYIDLYHAGLAPRGRPAGVFFLAGPTGTGKTSTAQAIASELHGAPQILRVDCGEYQHSHEIARLIGAPPGYLGHRETTPVLSQQRLNGCASEKSSLSIVLFDEIEKAADAFFNILLGILDYGKLKLGDNSSVNFEECFIFMTSNLGASDTAKLSYGTQIGINDGAPPEPLSASRIKDIVDRAIRKRMSSEFLNRIDEFIVYKHLSYMDSLRIALITLESIEQFIKSRTTGKKVTIKFDMENLCKFLADNCTDPKFGARYMQRYAQKNITVPIAKILTENQSQSSLKITVDVEDKQILVSASTSKGR